MNNKSIKRLIACLLILTGIASVLTAYASSMFDHQGVVFYPSDVSILQGPHPIPPDDPMYTLPGYTNNCHRILYTRTFTCDCHGKASDIVKEYAPHNPEWTYSSSERCDIYRCKECGQECSRRNHWHAWRNTKQQIQGNYVKYFFKCATCGSEKTELRRW